MVVFCSDVWGFVWSGCCALVDAVACICTCCCGCARCIRLWSCHLYLVLFICLLSAVCCLHPGLCICLCTALYPVLYPSVPLVCLVWSCSPLLHLVPTSVLYPAPVICSVLSGPVVCSGALYLTCSCSGCCSSWSCILVPVHCPVWSGPVPDPCSLSLLPVSDPVPVPVPGP